jgi:hypothetical protein
MNRGDFSGWKYIQTQDESATGEEEREKAKELVVKVLDKMMAIGWSKWKIRFSFSELNLSDSEASMRCVFQGTSGTGATMHRETEVCGPRLGVCTKYLPEKSGRDFGLVEYTNESTIASLVASLVRSPGAVFGLLPVNSEEWQTRIFIAAEKGSYSEPRSA